MFTSLETRASLLERMQRGEDQAAWAEFVQAYTPLVVGVARGARLRDEQVDEVAQDTWQVLKCFRALDGPFDREKGRFRAWLHGVIRHKVLDLRRRERRGAFASMDAGALDPPETVAEIDELIETQWRLNVLDRARRELARRMTPQAYQALDLYAFQGQPVKRVARLLGLRVSAVYLAKTRGLKRLSELVAEIEREEDAR